MQFNSYRARENEYFLHAMLDLGKIPEAVLVRALNAMIDLLETIHFSQVWNEGSKQSGLVWNDVKPEHLYWDPAGCRLTVIDWGNADFLEADGITKDRQHSAIDDYQQFSHHHGGFISEANPDLHARLDWPPESTPGNAYTDGVNRLKKRLGCAAQTGACPIQATPPG